MEFYVKYGKTFPVPTTVAEHLLKVASHDQLKILLYVLCRAEAALTPEQIAAACNVPAEAVEEAFVFWQNLNILQTSEPIPQVQLAKRESPAETPAAAAPEPVPVPQTTPPKPETETLRSSQRFSVRPSEIAERLNENAALKEVFVQTETACGHPLKDTELRSLFWMHEYLGFSPDIILMLTSYCAENQMFTVRQLDEIAAEWADKGIKTHAAVQADIQRRTEARSYLGRAMRVLHLESYPSKHQRELIEHWRTLGTSFEMLRVAYDKSMDYKNKLSVDYMDSIITDWAEQQIKTPAEAEAADARFREEQQKKKQSDAKKKSSRSAKKLPENEDASFNLDEFDLLVNNF